MPMVINVFIVQIGQEHFSDMNLYSRFFHYEN